MGIINRIIDLLHEQGKTQAEICSYIGVKPNVFTTWKTRETDPPAKYIVPICEFFQISPYTLLTGEQADDSNHKNAVYTGDIAHSKVTVTQDGEVIYFSPEGNVVSNKSGTLFRHVNQPHPDINEYSEILNYLNKLSLRVRRHAKLDIMELLEDNYPLENDT